MAEIERLTKIHAECRARVSTLVRDLEDEIARLKRLRLPTIRRAVKDAAVSETELRYALEAAPELFQRPKSQVFHGVRVGFLKSRGRLVFTNVKRVIELIKRHFPDQAEVLIKITETPVKTALAKLPAAELKKVGITVTDTGDQVLIQSLDSEIDKLVDALLKDLVDRQEEAA